MPYKYLQMAAMRQEGVPVSTCRGKRTFKGTGLGQMWRQFI